ncbi:MAG: hypothetical protein IKI30_05260 [Oxalobacter sp.]|nr:hypothetical protein [Oxalobacter sp.]
MADIDFTTWRFIGEGSERRCYQDPKNPARLIKISPKANAKQSLREIEYYQSLIDHKVPFDHIPRFYGKFEQGAFIGVEQEMILASPDSSKRAPRLGEYLDRPLSEAEIAELHIALDRLRDYLMQWNIVVSDLQISNIVVQKHKEGIRLFIIDGLGGTELIPLSHWFKSICRQKTVRHWAKLCRKITRRNPKVTF